MRLWRLQVREYLEKNYEETSGTDTVKLALRALTETVEPGSKNIEIAIMTRHAGVRPVPSQLQLPPSPQSVGPEMTQGVLSPPVTTLCGMRGLAVCR